MIQPRNDYVLIERIETLPQGLIAIPEVAKEKSILGKVVAVGPGKWIEGINGGLVRKTPEVKPGDIVYFSSKWCDMSPTHYSDDKLKDKNLHLIQEADIFLKVANAPGPS